MKRQYHKKGESKAKQLCLCITLHIFPFDNIDNEIKAKISSFLQKFPYSEWKEGNYWNPGKTVDLRGFPDSFEKEIQNFNLYLEGIQTRNIGSIIFENPSLKEDTAVSFFITSFRKIHDGYCITFYALGKEQSLTFMKCIPEWQKLKSEGMELIETMLIRESDTFKDKLVGPPTIFYAITTLNADVDKNKIEEELREKSSTFNKFVKTLLCTQGTKNINLPASLIDDNILTIRHPSFNYSFKLNENFFLIPLNKINIEVLIKTIDILSSIEFYFANIFMYAELSGQLLAQLKSATQPIHSIIKKLHFSFHNDVSGKMSTLRSSRLKLLDMYITANNALDEIEHSFSDLTYLVSSTIIQSSHSQIFEKQFSTLAEGVVKSIGIDAEMRVKNAQIYISKIGGRSYSMSSEVSSILSTYRTEELNTNMLRYTKQVKGLTVFIAILTALTLLYQFKEEIVKIILHLSKVITQYFN